MAFERFQKTHDLNFALIDAAGTGTVNSDFVSLAKSHHAAFVIVVGTLGADVVFSLRESIIAGAAPGGDVALAGKTVTLGIAESDSISILEVAASELNVAGGFVNVSIRSAAVGAADVAVGLILWSTRYSPL